MTVAYGRVEPTAFPEKRVDIQAWSQLPRSVLAWLPITLSTDGDLQVKLVAGEPRPLAEAIRDLPERRLILTFLENRPDTVSRLLKIIDDSGAADRILIQSPIDRLLHEVREARPLWLFGTSQALMTRFKMMASVGLVAAVPIEGDALVLEVLPKRMSEYSKAVIDEGHRRHLRVFAGPVDTQEEAASLFALGVDGVMVTDPAVIKVP